MAPEVTAARGGRGGMPKEMKSACPGGLVAVVLAVTGTKDLAAKEAKEVRAPRVSPR